MSDHFDITNLLGKMKLAVYLLKVLEAKYNDQTKN